MAKELVTHGDKSRIERVFLPDSSSTTGAGLTGLTFSSSGLIISNIADNEATATVYTQAGSTIETIATLGTYAAPTATKCRFKEVDATNHPGLYEIQLADARYAVSNAEKLIITVSGATNLAPTFAEIQLANLDLYDSVRAGLTALPNAAADAAGGLPISDAGGLDLDAKLANTNEVTAARMAALTDWIDGGRLDLIIDAVLVDTGTTLEGKIDTIDTVVDAVKVQTDKLLFDASNFVKTAVNDIIIAALAKFMTVDSGETTAVAGSVAKIAQGAAGGSVDVATFSGAASTTVDAIKAKTDTIGSGTVTVTSPVALDQNVTLVKGDDYKAADGRALDFINAAGTWPDLTGATINFKAAYQLQPTNSFTEATGSVVVASGVNQQVRIEIDGTDTAGLPAGSYEYDVEATLASGNTVTLVSSEGKPNVELTLLASHAP